MHAARGALPRLLMPRGYASSLLARARAGSSPARGVRAAALSTAPPSPPPPPLRYSDDYLRGVLGSVETIAVVGASADWKRPSYFAMKYLQHKGYRCVPINPKAAAAGEEILGERAYGSLDAAAEGALGGAAFDMVDVFRNADAAPAVAADAVAHGAKVLWLQLGVRHDGAAAAAEAAGLRVESKGVWRESERIYTQSDTREDRGRVVVNFASFRRNFAKKECNLSEHKPQQRGSGSKLACL